MNDARAKFHMARILDPVKPGLDSYQLLADAAAAGDPVALTHLGNCFIGKKEIEKAAWYYRCAAERGCEEAQAPLQELAKQNANNYFVCFHAAIGLHVEHPKDDTINSHFIRAIRKHPEMIYRFEDQNTTETVRSLLPLKDNLKPLLTLFLSYRAMVKYGIPLDVREIIFSFLLAGDEATKILLAEIKLDHAAKRSIFNKLPHIRPVKKDKKSVRFFQTKLKQIKNAGAGKMSYIEAEELIDKPRAQVK
jgi:hypothetical protein